MNRRSFLGSILAAAAAPVFIKPEILMPVKKVVAPSMGFYEGVDLYVPDQMLVTTAVSESIFLPEDLIREATLQLNKYMAVGRDLDLLIT